MYDYVSVEHQDEQIYTPQEETTKKPINMEQIQQGRIDQVQYTVEEGHSNELQ